MNLGVLKDFAKYLNENLPLKLRHIKRVGDNVFKVEMDREVFYFDLSKGKSQIYTTNEQLMAHKIYQAPFDKSLQKYCFNAILKKAEVDGNNRILCLFLENGNAYKSQEVILQAEFTGKNTNLILLDSKNIVLDALRHLTKEQSFREVKIGNPLLALPQPKEIKKTESKPLKEALAQNYIALQETRLNQKITHSKKQILKKIEQSNKILKSLEKEEEIIKEAKTLSTYAKNILANLYLYPNFFGEVLELGDLKIPVPKEARSLSEAAQMYFAQSKKLNQKAKNIHLQEKNLQDKINFYNNLLTMIQNVTNLQNLSILDSHSKKDSNKKQKESKKYESFFIEGFKISIGKSENENIALLKDAKAEDIWMHIQGIPSSHLIIHCGKMKISDIIIFKAAEILVGFAKGFSGNYAIDYTKRKFVKVQEGANVVYNNQKTITLTKG